MRGRTLVLGFTLAVGPTVLAGTSVALAESGAPSNESSVLQATATAGLAMTLVLCGAGIRILRRGSRR